MKRKRETVRGNLQIEAIYVFSLLKRVERFPDDVERGSLRGEPRNFETPEVYVEQFYSGNVYLGGLFSGN